MTSLVNPGLWRGAVSWITSILLVFSSGQVVGVPAFAFVPTNLRAALLTSPFDETHQSITETAITEIDSEFFGVSRLTRPMKKAMEQIVDANAEVDQDQTTSAKHFDGESFPEGQARLASLLGDIETALTDSNAQGARSKLGQALHTIQDFYSHSNWVEMGNAGPNPVLGRASGIINRLSDQTPTCRDCIPCVNCDNNLLLASLTSGYYGARTVSSRSRLSAAMAVR
jgi:von Willebrand factor A domain-containing protein 7